LFFVVLALQVVGCKPLVPLAAASQHMGYTATSSQLGNTSISFTYCITQLYWSPRGEVLQQQTTVLYSIAAVLHQGHQVTMLKI